MRASAEGQKAEGDEIGIKVKIRIPGMPVAPTRVVSNPVPSSSSAIPQSHAIGQNQVHGPSGALQKSSTMPSSAVTPASTALSVPLAPATSLPSSSSSSSVVADDSEAQEKRSGAKSFRYLRHCPLYCPRIAEADYGDIDVLETEIVPPILLAEDCLVMYRRALGDSTAVAGTELGPADQLQNQDTAVTAAAAVATTAAAGPLSSVVAAVSGRPTAVKEEGAKAAIVKDEHASNRSDGGGSSGGSMLQQLGNPSMVMADLGDEVQLTELTFSLRDPISLVRLTLPCKGLYCQHLQCFGLDVYRIINKQRMRHSSQFRCPLCDLHCPPGIVFVDQVTARLLGVFPEDDEIDDVLVRRDGENLWVSGSNGSGSSSAPLSVSSLLASTSLLPVEPQPTHETSLPALYLTTTLDDLLDVLNTYPSSHLTAIWSISQQSCDRILMQKPFYSATYQGLRHALQVVTGVGAMTARRLVDRLYEYIDRIKQGKYLVDSGGSIGDAGSGSIAAEAGSGAAAALGAGAGAAAGSSSGLGSAGAEGKKKGPRKRSGKAKGEVVSDTTQHQSGEGESLDGARDRVGDLSSGGPTKEGSAMDVAEENPLAAALTTTSAVSVVCRCGKTYKNRASFTKHTALCTVGTEPQGAVNTTEASIEAKLERANSTSSNSSGISGGTIEEEAAAPAPAAVAVAVAVAVALAEPIAAGNETVAADVSELKAAADSSGRVSLMNVDGDADAGVEVSGVAAAGVGGAKRSFAPSAPQAKARSISIAGVEGSVEADHASVSFDLPEHALKPPPRGMYTFFNPYHAPTPGHDKVFPQFAPFRYTVVPAHVARTDSSFIPQPRVPRAEPPQKKARGGGGGGGSKDKDKDDQCMSAVMADFAGDG